MVLIYFSRMKMKGERFFFFYLDNIDVYFPLILMQKLSVYIRDNSVNLYREETLKNILLIFHFPFETRTTLHMKYNMFLPKWKIQLITILVTSGITKKKKKSKYSQFLIIQGEKLPFVNYVFIDLLLFPPTLYVCFCVCVITYLKLSFAHLQQKKRMYKQEFSPQCSHKGQMESSCFY